MKHRVRKKLKKFHLPPSLAKSAALAASEFATPRVVAKNLSRRLCKDVPKQMLEKGLTVKMKELFRHEAYFVLQMIVIRVDMSILTGVGTIDISDNWFLCWMIGHPHKRQLEEDYCKSWTWSIQYTIIRFDPM